MRQGSHHDQASFAPAEALAADLRLAWTKRTHRGFLPRAEDFFRFAADNRERADEPEEMAVELGKKPGGRAELGTEVLRTQRSRLKARYGDSPDAASHGESLLAFYQRRFVPGGLYLMDEP